MKIVKKFIDELLDIKGYVIPIGVMTISIVLTLMVNTIDIYYQTKVDIKVYGIARFQIPPPVRILQAKSDNGTYNVTNDFSLDVASNDDMANSQETTVPVLPFYVDDDPDTPVAIEEPITQVSIDTAQLPTTYASPDLVDLEHLDRNLAKGQLVAETSDPRILAAVDSYNRIRLSLPICTTLANQTNYCVPMVRNDDPSHPRQLIAKQVDFIHWLLDLEEREGLPFGSLVVSGMIESKLGTIMGKHNGGYCNKYGYCGYFQFGKTAWKDYGIGSFKAGVRDNYKVAEATVRLKKGYCNLLGINYKKASNFELYMAHQQGPDGSKKIMSRIKQGHSFDPTKGNNRAILNNIANNIPKTQRNGLVNEIGKSSYELTNGHTMDEVMDTWYNVWGRNALGHTARVLPVILEMKGINYYYK